MDRGKLTGFLLLSLALLGASACAPQEPVLGVVLPETGRAAGYGALIKDGMELAVKEVNAGGGIDGQPLRLVYADSGTDPATGVAAARRLVEEEDVLALVGAVSSGVTTAIVDEISRPMKVITLSPASSSPVLTDRSNYFFRVYPSDSLESARMADMISELRLRKMVVFAVDDEYGEGYSQGLVEHFSRKKNREVLETFEYDPTTADFTELVEQARALEFEVIFIIGYVEPMVDLLRAIRDAGIEVPVFCSGSVTHDFAERAGEAAEGVVYSRPDFRRIGNADRVGPFIEAFTAEYGHEPDDYAAYGYDAIMMLVQVLREGARSNSDLLLALRRQNGKYHGVTGDILFGNSADVLASPTTFIVHQGEPVPYQEYLDQGGTPPGADGSS